MKARGLDCRAVAGAVLAQARRRAAAVARRRGRAPKIAIVAAAGTAAGSYLQAKLRACAAAGVDANVHHLSPGPRIKMLGLLAEIAADASVDAVIVETPYPRGLSAADIASEIPRSKDAEGLSPEAYGRLFLAKTWPEAARLVGPCTAFAVARLVRAAAAPLPGRTAVVIGRSATVGRPAAHLLSALGLTVTVAHSRTRRLAALCRAADVLVAAAGTPGLVKASWVKRGAAVVDVGANAARGRIVGDVAPGAAARARVVTPVPGGVGPVTTAVAVLQTVALAERAVSRSAPGTGRRPSSARARRR